ncbi:uncharacterized protein LOC123545684 [Mercenaria mercenaria]|uniref:uncharacterized protein LOC123545684 n=1 Tax=Mercenaria mercenaria TaxID=6596 RepID=UPI00234F48DB|nr:uncharacterized protein LOC123545684 [Mercenaria mercenaria]
MHSGQSISPEGPPKPFVIVISDSEDDDSDSEDSHSLLRKSKGSLDLASSSNTAFPASSDTSQASSNSTSLRIANLKSASEVRQAAAVDTPAAAVIDLTLDDTDDNTAGQSATNQVFTTNRSFVSTPTPSSSIFSPDFKDCKISTFSAPVITARNSSTHIASPEPSFNSSDRGSPSVPSPFPQYDRGDGAYKKSTVLNTSPSVYSAMDTNDDCATVMLGLPLMKDARGRPHSPMDTVEITEPMEIGYDAHGIGFGYTMLSGCGDTMLTGFCDTMLTGSGDTMLTGRRSNCPFAGFGSQRARDEEKMDIDNDGGVLPVLLVADDIFKGVPKNKVTSVRNAKGNCRKRRRLDQRDVEKKVQQNKRRRIY